MLLHFFSETWACDGTAGDLNICIYIYMHLHKNYVWILLSMFGHLLYGNCLTLQDNFRISGLGFRVWGGGLLKADLRQLHEGSYHAGALSKPYIS